MNFNKTILAMVMVSVAGSVVANEAPVAPKSMMEVVTGMINSAKTSAVNFYDDVTGKTEAAKIANQLRDEQIKTEAAQARATREAAEQKAYAESYKGRVQAAYNSAKTSVVNAGNVVKGATYDVYPKTTMTTIAAVVVAGAAYGMYQYAFAEQTEEVAQN